MHLPEQVKPAERALSIRILEEEGEKHAGTRENEDHINTEEVKSVARRLIDEENVTCDEASELTKMVFLVENFTSPPIRMKNKRGLQACHTFIHPTDGLLKDIITNRIKDDDALARTGVLVLTHRKHEMIKEVYAVMVVLGRAVFRLHGCVLDKGICPLDSLGHELNDGNRTQLLKSAGMWFLGLSDFTEHITRTFQLTLLIDKCIKLGRAPEQCPVVKQALREMHTTMNIAMTHYNIRKNERVAWGTCISDIDDFEGEASEGVQLMKMAVNEIKEMLRGSSSPKETLSFFDMDSAFEDLSLGGDKSVLKGIGQPPDEVSTVRAEKEKAFAAKEYAAKEKALERAEAMAAKKFAAEERAVERAETLAAKEFAAKENALIAKVCGGGASGSNGVPRGLPHSVRIS